MNCVSLVLALSLGLCAAAPCPAPAGLSDACVLSADLSDLPDLPDISAEAEALASCTPPSSEEGKPVTYEARLPVLMYHNVVMEGEPCNEMTVTVRRLERDLRWLADNGYETVLPRELAAGMPLPKKPVLITFDDGYRSNYTLAYPLLQQYQAKAVIAVMTYMPDNSAAGFLSWDMCREMTDSGLVEIGSHGYVIHNLDSRGGNFAPGEANGVQRRKGESQAAFKKRVLDDLWKSYNRIAVETHVPPVFFSYPFGVTDPDADAYLKELFPVTCVTGPGKQSASLAKGLHQLPRFTVTMEKGPEAFLKENGEA